VTFIFAEFLMTFLLLATYIGVSSRHEPERERKASGADHYVRMNRGGRKKAVSRGWLSRFTGGRGRNKDSKKADQPSADKKHQGVDGLPTGWTKEYTEDGTEYYFNKNTGQSTWARPE